MNTISFVNPIAFDVMGASAAICLGERNIRAAIADGSLAVHYHGAKALILREDLEAFVRSLPSERGDEL